MKYRNLRKLFHISSEDAERVYAERLASEDALHLDLLIGAYEAFCLVNSEVYRLILKAERLDKEIGGLARSLPGKAIEQYMMNCLIDEVVLTNEIEGVSSSRREIGEALEKLEKNDRRGRFHGIVEKYLALQGDEDIPIATCKDIRDIYDGLVLEEVVSRNEGNAPDGTYFRAGSVDVLDAAGRPVHHGIEPEGKLNEVMGASLALLNNPDVEVLVRVSLFHFLFGYAHPFYDGNGRTNRFISSYVLSREFSPLVGFRLSYSIKERIETYYKAFSLCEHALNKGDLTPFVIMFSEIVVDAMEGMRASLADRKAALSRAEQLAERIPGIMDGKQASVVDRLNLASLLMQAALFADMGISVKEIAEVLSVTEPTVYARMKFFTDCGLAVKRRLGRNVFYSMDMNALDSVVGAS